MQAIHKRARARASDGETKNEVRVMRGLPVQDKVPRDAP